MRSIQALISMFFFSLGPSVLAGGPGTPDSSFGLSGMQVIDVDDFDVCEGILERSDGRIFVLGNTGHSDFLGFDMDYCVLSVNSDGSLASDFANNGLFRADFGQFEYSTASDFLLQADGRILVLGYAYNQADPVNRPFCLSRLMADGSLDYSFGDSGTVALHFLGGTELAKSILIQPDGKILVAGQSYDTTAVHLEYPCLARLLPNGRPDSSFGETGKIAVNFTSGLIHARPAHSNAGLFNDVVLLPDGRILCGGSYLTDQNYACTLVQFSPDGLLDSTFYQNGILKWDYAPGCNNYVEEIVLMENGDLGLLIYVDCWYLSKDFYFTQLNPGGVVGDPLTLDFSENADFGEAMLRDRHGQIVIAGRSVLPVNDNPGYLSNAFAVCRLDGQNENLDPGFGSGGQFDFEVNPGNQSGASSICEQSDGKLLLGGFVNQNDLGNLSDIAIIRLNGGLATATQNSIEAAMQLKVFPNPCQDWLTVRFDGILKGFEIDLYNCNGQIVRHGVIPAASQTKWDVHALPAGIYLLQARSTKGVVTRRIVLE